MRILHLRASNFYGGPERQLHLHGREAADSRYQITVASFSEDARSPEFLDVITRDNISTHIFNVSSAYDIQAVSTLRSYLRKENISILCTHDYRSNLIGLLAARRVRTRWIVFSRGFTRDNLKVRFYHAMDRFLIRQANHIVAVSHAQKKKLRRLFIRDRDISVIPNAIDPENLVSVKPIDLRARFDWDSNTTVCICGGRFSREKGQLDLVNAAAMAVRANPKLRFVLFGDGPDLGKVRNAINYQGCGSSIVCPGFEKNLIGCLKGADLFINPSHSEGLPNIVLEAMAVGIMVIATAVGGVPEIVKDNQTGLLVPSRNPDLLAEAIARGADILHRRESITAAALELITRKHSFEVQFRQLTKLYDEISDGLVI